MNILTILGSARVNGNTAKALKYFEEMIGNSHDVERINIARMKIKGCLGCERCQQVIDEPGCIQKDDFNEVVEKMLNADVVIYASPVYVWSFTAQMKALIDRLCCLVKWKESEEAISLMKDKQTALLVTCGGDEENNADLIQEIFKREMDYQQCRILGKYIIPSRSGDAPAQLDEKAIHTIQQMYSDITKEMN